MPAPTRFTGHRSAVYALAPGDRPGTFLSGDGSGAVVRWDRHRPDQGEQVIDAGEGIFSLHWAAAQGLLWVGTHHGRCIVVDMHRRRVVADHATGARGLFAFATLPDGQVVSAGGDGIMRVHSVPDGGIRRQIPLTDAKLRCLAMDGAGRSLAVGANDGIVRVLEPVLLNERATISTHAARTGAPERHTGCSALAYHPHKPVLLTGGKDGHLELWRTDADHRALLALPAHRGAIYRIIFDPTGQRFATAARDKTCVIWDAATLEPLHRLDRAAGGHTHSVNTALWMDHVLITASDDRMVHAWG